ncbi:MAG TPA: DUF86 domain-containing protein [Sedimentisphaerales bacterium]|nr:DUF86 domain-containing protein [Sedimentisphaerales bacterium]
MTRDLRLYIEDMIDSIAKIEQYTSAIDEQDFLADTQVQDAVLRRLEIMGEAVKNIPQGVRDKYPQIPWKRIAGLRDVLIHAYFGVNVRRAWKMAKRDIFELKQELLKVKKDLENTAPD